MEALKLRKLPWKKIIVHELMVILYLSIVFAFFTNYRRLILAHYDISYRYYGIGVLEAVILAKIIWFSERVLHLGRKLENESLIIPTLYKSLLFTVCLALFSVIEFIVGHLWHGHNLAEAFDEMKGMFDDDWWAVTLVSFFSLIPFFAVKELARVVGEEPLGNLFFHRSQSHQPPQSKSISVERHVTG